MGLPEIADFARNFGAMVRVHGPDPKGLKMRKHAFHQYNSGKTTISASGMLLPETLYGDDVAKMRFSGTESGQTPVLVVTVASVVEPFLSQQHRGSDFQGGLPELIPAARIDVMLQGKLKLKEEVDSAWLSAKLIRLVDVPESSVAVQSLTESSSGPLDHGWEVGWSLASNDNISQPSVDANQNQSHFGVGQFGIANAIGKSATKIAILGVFTKLKAIPKITISPSNKVGEFFLAVGSPFGVLSPLHFFNSVSVGSIANCYPPRTVNVSLLMVDIRCLPGMEGGLIIGEHGHFIGILIRPLKQKNGGAEIQLVIPWEAIATACSDLLLKVPKNAEEGNCINEKNLNAVGNPYSHEPDGYFSYEHISRSKSPLPIQKAISSVCLITIDDGVWASGIILNDQGLVLTNAHLLEPWRFGKTTVNAGRNETSLGNDLSRSSKFGLSYRGYRRIRVRLGQVSPWVWRDAKVVHVCKGPLDVALLQLECDTNQLFPIDVDLLHPSLGSKAYVIGHGIFGPRCGISPSVCAGVVANIVKVKSSVSHQPLHVDSHIPAMLQTTAAVHPGGSGGAVVNSEGQMIGLVTSNARHGGGTVIPHLNFSILCAVLAPIFEFARDMKDFSLLQNLDRPNEELSSVWALTQSLPRKPSPSLPGLPILEDSKEGKGSKFAKFIAESDKLLKTPAQLSKIERRSNEILSSRL